MLYCAPHRDPSPLNWLGAINPQIRHFLLKSVRIYGAECFDSNLRISGARLVVNLSSMKWLKVCSLIWQWTLKRILLSKYLRFESNFVWSIMAMKPFQIVLSNRICFLKARNAPNWLSNFGPNLYVKFRSPYARGAWKWRASTLSQNFLHKSWPQLKYMC